MMIDRITANPKILGGKPVIRGTRLSVEFILELLASGMSEEAILEDYPHITREDIRACLKYAARSCKNEIYLELDPVAA
ncbi:MAG: DUF433 domain-containing protein [Chloroflexi bacterium]|nr:DUF433 domain-containing protein [Chloroflexota bacterium]